MPAVDGLKDLATVGGARTVSVLEAAAPLFAFEDVVALVVFTYTPADDALTFTVNVHEPEAGIVPPTSVRLLEPAAAVAAPPQVEPSEGVPAFVRPAG